MPVVSIVIPVFNQVPFTLACIDALLAHETRYSFEILIGDDASTDATAAALSVGMPRVRHFRHATNLGFVRNCNSTAGHARGRYVVFLNNDTQVLPGWLDELVGTLETGENIGLVILFVTIAVPILYTMWLIASVEGWPKALLASFGMLCWVVVMMAGIHLAEGGSL